ncbi:HNH endonuclease [Amycolatopsis thailandensis]|uniref:HNH endonuclease n=1 Tax=Amycolatopsis thailandensis TaxID=589330 RepID=UPI001ABFDBE6|nr:HNH endonuclease signature motif containing protein [Amycolatopsis thailandensis]
MAKKRRNRDNSKGKRKEQKGVILYHDMAVYENFERCALRLFSIVKSAQRVNPDAPRYLYLRVQGHKNSKGAFDHDAWEIINNFVLGHLGSYLTGITTPIAEMKNGKKQCNDIPDQLDIVYPEDDDSFWCDVDLLPVKPREVVGVERKSPPSKEMIADYLGIRDDPCCLICWSRPVERAHVVPVSLGGSMNVRNFALLCSGHHREAPDIADAEGFWAWVDYAEMRDSGSKWEGASDKVREHALALGSRIGKIDRSELDFVSAIKFELRHLYGWEDVDFSNFSWELHEEYHRVLDAATGRHFGVDKKVSTHAWAYNVALYRIDRNKESRLRRRRKVLLFDTIPSESSDGSGSSTAG